MHSKMTGARHVVNYDKNTGIREMKRQKIKYGKILVSYVFGLYLLVY